MKKLIFHKKQTHNYFEGYYCRFTDRKWDINLAVIFAVTYAESDPHAFIQIFDATNKKFEYLRFEVDAFRFEEDTVMIAEHALSDAFLRVKSKHADVDVHFTRHHSLKQESAMGFLAKWPLECYQDVLYMSMKVEGQVKLGDKNTRDIKATGYMETTYGKKFPSRWFWLQANHFGSKDVKLSLSGGKVPTLFWHKFGFFAVLHFQGEEHVFATYNLSRLRVKSRDQKHVSFRLKKGRKRLIIKAKLKDPMKLVGPAKSGAMTLDVFESITSTVSLTLMDRKRTLLKATSDYAGFEWMYQKNRKG